MRRAEPMSLKQVRERRNAPERDLGIRAAVGELSARVRRQHRQSGGAADAWAAVIPAALGAQAELVRLTRGVLHVRPADAGVRFALDRLLRAGAERALQNASAGKIKKVRLV